MKKDAFEKLFIIIHAVVFLDISSYNIKSTNESTNFNIAGEEIILPLPILERDVLLEEAPGNRRSFKIFSFE